MRPRLLVVHDSQVIKHVIELTLRSEYDVTTMSSARDVVDSLGRAVPALLICATGLSDRPGYDLCHEVKSQLGLSQVRVLLLPGAFERYDLERAARAGVDDYLVTPFDPQALLAKVRTLLAGGAVAPAVEHAAGRDGGPTSLACPSCAAPLPAQAAGQKCQYCGRTVVFAATQADLQSSSGAKETKEAAPGCAGCLMLAVFVLGVVGILGKHCPL